MPLRRNRRSYKTLFTTGSIFLVVTLFLIYRDGTNSPRHSLQLDYKTKLVLTFTTLWSLPDWYLDIQNSRIGSNCPYKCEYSKDKALLHQAAAVIFHGMSKDLFPVNDILLNPRHPELWDQIWIFKLNEAPVSYPDPGLLSYANTFNWTMTYRWDSDVFAPNGQFMPKNQARRPFKLFPLKLDDVSLSRKKLVAAMISNCNEAGSRRLNYISLMKNYTEVDVFGSCGKLRCDKDANCYQLLGKEYKFFLAFENSFCEDYVTEKAFQPLRYGMVPVVRSGANYSKILQKGSYINTQDFPSAQELVEYLKYLNQNHAEYRKYFEWREDYDINSDQECDLCTKIHQFNAKADRKSYANIYSWYHTNYTQQKLCTDPHIPLV